MVSEIGQNMLSRSIATVLGRIEESKLQRNALEVGRLFRVLAATQKLGDHFTNLATVFIRKDRGVSETMPNIDKSEG